MYPKGPVTPGGLTDRYLSDYPNLYGDLSAGSGRTPSTAIRNTPPPFSSPSGQTDARHRLLRSGRGGREVFGLGPDRERAEACHRSRGAGEDFFAICETDPEALLKRGAVVRPCVVPWPTLFSPSPDPGSSRIAAPRRSRRKTRRPPFARRCGSGKDHRVRCAGDTRRGSRRLP